MPRCQVRQCAADACRFRFPWTEHDPPALRCPRCGGPVQVIIEQERSHEAPSPPPDTPAMSVNLAALVDNVRSAFNVGSIFRCADGAGVTHLYLCGVTPTPAHTKVAKTALGAEASVGWSYHTNAVDLATQLKAAGWQLWALEDGPDSESLFRVQPPRSDRRLLLVIGNEVTGIDPGVLALCDRTLSIPMGGAKRSLNVAIAFGIAAYSIVFAPHLQRLTGSSKLYTQPR
jgi:23S rRNA (guanosine2251-2'-O)-methyltransferase